MKLFILLAGIVLLLFLGTKVLDIHSSPIPTPTISLPTPTDTPIPTATPTLAPQQQTSYFESPLYCPQVYLQGVTPCVDVNKTPVACVAQFHPDGSPAINLICGIPGNSSSVKSCINYTNNPSVVICY